MSAIPRAHPRCARALSVRPPPPHTGPRQKPSATAKALGPGFRRGDGISRVTRRDFPLSRLRERVRVRARPFTVSLKLASAARTAALCSSRVPSRPRRGRGGKSPQGRAHDARPRGCVLFGYFLLHKQEKVTPSQGCEGSSQGRESGFVGRHQRRKEPSALENHPHPTLSLKERAKR